MEASVLRLLADDADGLGVIAAAVQDALVRPDAMKYDRKSRAFGLEMNRFQWEKAGKKPPFFRSRAILAFTDVLSVRNTPLPPGEDAVLGVMDIIFTPAAEPPGGTVTLVFTGDTMVQLNVECLDVTLIDTGPAWPTKLKPDHMNLERDPGDL
jgi:hypothetical protein